MPRKPLGARPAQGRRRKRLQQETRHARRQRSRQQARFARACPRRRGRPCPYRGLFRGRRPRRARRQRRRRSLQEAPQCSPRQLRPAGLLRPQLAQQAARDRHGLDPVRVRALLRLRHRLVGPNEDGGGEPTSFSWLQAHESQARHPSARNDCIACSFGLWWRLRKRLSHLAPRQCPCERAVRALFHSRALDPMQVRCYRDSGRLQGRRGPHWPIECSLKRQEMTPSFAALEPCLRSFRRSQRSTYALCGVSREATTEKAGDVREASAAAARAKVVRRRSLTRRGAA